MNQYPELPRWAKRELSKIHKKMQKSNPKYPDGSTVLYKESPLVIINSYWKDYGSPGWFYNLDYPDMNAIPEHQLSELNS